jgi:2-aminoethylphosphonate-pyruvate transaminase
MFAAIGIDARTTPFDALVAASGKCVEGPPGMGFVFVRKGILERCAGHSTSLALDLHDQWAYMERTTQWRYTPPTHVVVAFNAALDQLAAEGGQPARLARYTRNCETLVAGMAELGFRSFLRPDIQAPIIVTFHAPVDPAMRSNRSTRCPRGASSSTRASSRKSRRSASDASAPSARRDAPGRERGARHPR